MNVTASGRAHLPGHRAVRGWRCREAPLQKCFTSSRGVLLNQHDNPIRHQHRRASVAEQTSNLPNVGPDPEPKQLVDELLDRIKNSGIHGICEVQLSLGTKECCQLADSGLALQEEEEASVNNLINQREAVGQRQVMRLW